MLKKFVLVFLPLCVISLLIWRGHRILKKDNSPGPVNFVRPEAESHAVGSVFAYPLRLEDTHGTINTIQADLGFDPLFLQVVDIETTGSFASIFLQKIIDNQTGFVRLTGALPNPGYAGSGLFGTVYFHALAPGDTVVHYLESCQILANDGAGTNLISHFPHAYYHLTLEPAGSSPNPTATPRYHLPVEPTASGATPLYLYQYSNKLPSPPPIHHTMPHR